MRGREEGRRGVVISHHTTIIFAIYISLLSTSFIYQTKSLLNIVLFVGLTQIRIHILRSSWESFKTEFSWIFNSFIKIPKEATLGA